MKIAFHLYLKIQKKGGLRMSYETYIKDVKRLNQRIVQTTKSFSKESPLYMEYETKIKKMFPSDMININKRGEIQISRSKQFYNTNSSEFIQRVMNTTKSVAEIRSQARENLKSELPSAEKITQKMITQRVKDRWKVETELREALDILYGREDELAQKAIETMSQKGIRTYDELKNVINQSKNENIVIKNIFEGL